MQDVSARCIPPGASGWFVIVGRFLWYSLRKELMGGGLLSPQVLWMVGEWKGTPTSYPMGNLII